MGVKVERGLDAAVAKHALDTLRLGPLFTYLPANWEGNGGDFQFAEMPVLRSADPLYIGRMTPRASEGISGTKPPVRIAVDMDEVIADYFGEQVARYESWSGTAVDISATEGKRLRECVPPEHREFISRLPRTPGFFGNLKMIKGSRDALQILSCHNIAESISSVRRQSIPTGARQQSGVFEKRA